MSDSGVPKYRHRNNSQESYISMYIVKLPVL